MGHSGYGTGRPRPRGRATPNVFLELTAVYLARLRHAAQRQRHSGRPALLLQVNGILEHMVSEAGSGKMVFGTDLPWYSPLYAAGAVLFPESAMMPATTSCTATQNGC